MTSSSSLHEDSPVCIAVLGWWETDSSFFPGESSWTGWKSMSTVKRAGSSSTFAPLCREPQRSSTSFRHVKNPVRLQLLYWNLSLISVLASKVLLRIRDAEALTQALILSIIHFFYPSWTLRNPYTDVPLRPIKAGGAPTGAALKVIFLGSSPLDLGLALPSK